MRAIDPGDMQSIQANLTSPLHHDGVSADCTSPSTTAQKRTHSDEFDSPNPVDIPDTPARKQIRLDDMPSHLLRPMTPFGSNRSAISETSILFDNSQIVTQEQLKDEEATTTTTTANIAPADVDCRPDEDDDPFKKLGWPLSDSGLNSFHYPASPQDEHPSTFSTARRSLLTEFRNSELNAHDEEEELDPAQLASHKSLIEAVFGEEDEDEEESWQPSPKPSGLTTGPRIYDDPISDFFLSSSHIDDNLPTERIPSPELMKRLQNWQKVRPSFLNKTPRLLTQEYFANNGPLDCMREDEWEEVNEEEDAFNETYLETHYELLYTLGSGVFADVYEARHLESKAIVAIKKSKEPFDSYDDRWLQIIEVDHMRAIKENKHCVQLFNAWEQSGFLHLEMELCQSGSLRQYIDEHDQTIPEDNVWAIVYEIALGIKAIHDADIIHLDLKPSNILIDELGFIKIGDFGKSVRVPVDRTWVKGEGDRRYMAPDLLRDQFHKPADIFSLGMVVLEMATGKKLPDMGEPWEQLRLADYSGCEQEFARASKEMQDFIKWLLDTNWRERPTIDMIMEHPQIVKQRDQQQETQGALYDYVQLLKKTDRFPYHRVMRSSSPEPQAFPSPEY